MYVYFEFVYIISFDKLQFPCLLKPNVSRHFQSCVICILLFANKINSLLVYLNWQVNQTPNGNLCCNFLHNIGCQQQQKK